MKTPTTLFQLVSQYMKTVEATRAANPGVPVITYDADTGADLEPTPQGARNVIRVPWSDNAARALLSAEPVANQRADNGYVLPMPNPWG